MPISFLFFSFFFSSPSYTFFFLFSLFFFPHVLFLSSGEHIGVIGGSFNDPWSRRLGCPHHCADGRRHKQDFPCATSLLWSLISIYWGKNRSHLSSQLKEGNWGEAQWFLWDSSPNTSHRFQATEMKRAPPKFLQLLIPNDSSSRSKVDAKIYCNLWDLRNGNGNENDLAYVVYNKRRLP